MKTSRDRFERLAERALTTVPPRFRRLLLNVEISVRRRPGREAGRWRGSPDLLGLYSGPPRSAMIGPLTGPHQPARIVLYQDNLQSRCKTPAELLSRIAATLRPEIAHYFGFSEDEGRRAEGPR